MENKDGKMISSDEMNAMSHHSSITHRRNYATFLTNWEELSYSMWHQGLGEIKNRFKQASKFIDYTNSEMLEGLRLLFNDSDWKSNFQKKWFIFS